MIEAWTTPAIVAILLGGIGFVVLFVPVLIWESRRFGQIRFNRLVGAAMVAVFGVALFAYTIFPMPDQQWCATHAPPARNLDALEIVRANIAYWRIHGTRQLLSSFVFLQGAFNVLLFVPFGALLRRYFGVRAIWASVAGLLTSTLIELTQGTGAFGLLPCAYRVADVDDVILNTLGAVIGAFAAPLLLFFMTDARASERTRRQPRPVTRTRRLIGMIVDGSSFVVLPSLFLVSFRLVVIYVIGGDLPDQSPWIDCSAAAAAFVALVIPTLVGSGASLGQRAVWLEPQWPGPKRLALRSLCGFGGWMLIQVVGSIPGLPTPVSGVLGTIASGLAVATVILVLTDRNGRGLSTRAVGAGIEDSRLSE